jgi:hypothetical protein
MSQERRVIDMLSEGWTYQKTFWDSYMRSPHKRRAEAALEAKREIEDRPCIHGLKRSFDYRFKPKELTLFTD